MANLYRFREEYPALGSLGGSWLFVSETERTEAELRKLYNEARGQARAEGWPDEMGSILFVMAPLAGLVPVDQAPVDADIVVSPGTEA